MNIDEITFGLDAVRWLTVAAVAVHSWLVSRQSASNSEMLELRTRITTLEAQIKQVPSQAQLHELVVQVARIGGAIEAVNARIEPIAHSVVRMESYLLHDK